MSTIDKLVADIQRKTYQMNRNEGKCIEEPTAHNINNATQCRRALHDMAVKLEVLTRA